MKKKKLILAAIAASVLIPSVMGPVSVSAQELPTGFAKNTSAAVDVNTEATLRNALATDNANVKLTADITLDERLVIEKSCTIDLDGHTLTSSATAGTIKVKGGTSTIKGGTIINTAAGNPAAATVIIGDSGHPVVSVNFVKCTILMNGSSNDDGPYAVSTNGLFSKNSTVVLDECTIGGKSMEGKYAVYLPAGNVTLKKCDVTGAVSISGGDIAIEGGSFTAKAHNDVTYGTQTSVYNEAKTVAFIEKFKGSNEQFDGTRAMGDCILVIDKRGADYKLNSLTVKDASFNTGIKFANGGQASSYAIKYIQANGGNPFAKLDIRNNKYNGDPSNERNMFIDKDGKDVRNTVLANLTVETVTGATGLGGNLTGSDLATIAVSEADEVDTEGNKVFKVTGTSNYIEDYTNYWANPQDPTQNDGNFITLKFATEMSGVGIKHTKPAIEGESLYPSTSDKELVLTTRLQNFENLEYKMPIFLYETDDNGTVRTDANNDPKIIAKYIIDLSGVVQLKEDKEIETKSPTVEGNTLTISDDSKGKLKNNAQVSQSVSKMIDSLTSQPDNADKNKVVLVPEISVGSSTIVPGQTYSLSISYLVNVYLLGDEATELPAQPAAQVDPGKLASPIELEIAVPNEAGFDSNATVYVDHAGDLHDNYVGSSHLVQLNNGKAKIKINHFSDFTITSATAAQIRSYKVGDQTAVALSADDTDIPIPEETDVFIPVPEGMKLVDPDTGSIIETGPSTYKFNISAGNQVKFKALPTSGGLSGKEYVFKAEASSPVTPPSGGGVVKPVKKQTMYRVYNPNSGEHFYTANKAERDRLISLGWKDEGTAWTAPEKSDTPVFRVYNPNAGDHHYTTNAEERDVLVSKGWKDEGIGWYSDDKKGVTVYRLYNKNAVAGAHHYTTNAGERDYLVSVGWSNENIGWYGVK